ncbi:MAG: ribosomal protein S18-alanine N-acetyltransferase [Chloroflexi bacterium]|nr:ribosomal protein S18-alanine N-acetyltransferase [Chloroflexota bacterium]
MKPPVLPFKIEPMTLADIPTVVAIEHISYSMTWPSRAYEYELQHNDFAHYFVLRTSLLYPPQKEGEHFHQISNFSEQSHDRLRSPVPGHGEHSFTLQHTTIIGLSGFWLVAGEAHINTIAVHPNWRGLGLGEWLLLTLLDEGQALGAEVATLEVRPSNHMALALYHKYGFEQVARRLRYYSDNDEDALIFTTPPLALPDYQAMLTQRKVALFHRLAKIDRNQLE